MKKRIISRIDIKNNTLVKGIQLEGLRTLGNPKTYADYYYQNGIDEIFLMDVVASLYNRNGIEEIVKEVATDVFVPITVGGGIRTLKDIENMLKNGADKVSINSEAHKRPNFISEAVNTFGSSTIVCSIETVKISDKYYCLYDNGRETTGKELNNWILTLISAGVGEIVITSVLNEGMGAGFDKDIIRSLPTNIEVPIIVHGGFGNPSQITECLMSDKVDGVALASILHYYAKDKILNSDDLNRNEGNYLYLKSGKIPTQIQPSSIEQIKNFR